MSWTVDLITGLAAHLAARGVGKWDPENGLYTADDIAITYRRVPQSPDRAIALSLYGDQADIEQADARVRVQARIRGDQDPRNVDEIADAIFDELHGATNLVLGGVSVVQIQRLSVIPLGEDGNRRWERTDNYVLDTMRPTAHRPF